MVKLDELFSDYLRAKRQLEPATRDMSKRCFWYLIKSVGNIAANDFAYRHAERFHEDIADSRSRTTANSYVKMVRPAFRWAIRQGTLDADPFDGLRLYKVARKRIRIFEDREIQAILSSANKLWQARILLGYKAGLRRGEVLNLTLSDIDFARGLLYVAPKSETSHTWRWQPKDKDLRTIPMAGIVARELTAIAVDLPDGQPYLMLAPERYTGIIAMKRKGKLSDRIRMCPDENFTKPFNRIVERACVRHGTFHDLRRTFCTVLMENGMSPHEVMPLSGHANIETLMNSYVTVRSDLFDKARAVINMGPQSVNYGPCNQVERLGATGLEPATS